MLKYFDFNPLVKIELAVSDNLVRFGHKAALNPNLVFLAIDADTVSLNQLDDSTIASSHPLTVMKAGFPFSREIYADVCDRLMPTGVKALAFDVLFLSPKPEDPLWQAAIEKYRDRLVLGMNFSDDVQNETSKLLIPPSSLLPDQDAMDDRLGFVNFWKDKYGITVREAQYRTNLENIGHGMAIAKTLPMMYSLAARTVQKSGHGDLVPHDLESRMMRFAGAPETVFPTYSLYEIFVPSFWENNFQNGAYFKDKIILVGPQGDWAKDELLTPYGLMNGAEIHLNAMNALLGNDFLHPASDTFNAAAVIFSGLVALALAFLIPNIAARFTASVLVAGGYMAALMEAFNGPGWLLPAVGPLGVFGGSMGVGFVYDFVLAQVERMQLRAAFQRYTSPNVAKYLLDHLESYQEMLVGSRKPVTVLFSDVRGFTTKTEVAASEGKSQQHIAKLNEYLTEMVACVFRYDGALDKFIGDAVMAVWGNTPYNFGPKEDAVRAVRAAREMQAELKKLNTKWKMEGREEWEIGIGLNHGDAIVGDMGSRQRTEFAVIGDAVNLASRLESLTKEYGLDLLLGESVADLVRDVFYLRTVDLVVVKGKTKAVEAFTVIGEITDGLAPGMKQFLEAYEEGIRAFRSRAFERAATLFEEALRIQPDDAQSEEYLANCREFIRNPPGDEWTGVRVMTKK